MHCFSLAIGFVVIIASSASSRAQGGERTSDAVDASASPPESAQPRMAPFVPHAKGTDLVVRHVERHWCPTTDSAALTEGLRG